MTAVRQLGALLRLRWQMLRSPGAKVVTALTGLLTLWVVNAVVTSASQVEEAALATAVDIAPEAYLGFGLLAVIAPLTAGGGHHVLPPEQLSAFPVRASTQFLGGLLLAPVNLVWALQLLFLLGITAFLTEGGSFAAGAAPTGAFVALVTVAGQALAWLVVGARQSQRGRRVVTGAWVALAVVAAAVLQTGNVSAVVDASPTRSVTQAVLAGGAGNVQLWWPTTSALVLATLLAAIAGAHSCSWALRRPADRHAVRHTASRRRRRLPAGELRALVAVDRASVWRAPALRRGGIVLLLLPGVAAAALRVPWESLIVLPGLVAAGAGLLFGINAFALDASGAVWLASLPARPRLLFLSKLVVTTETVLGAVVVAALAGTVRSGAPPTPSEAAAVVGSGVACAALVVALGMRASVRRPHRADLSGPRDAVAPPGALTAASARLALPCALLGMVVAASAELDVVWFPLLLSVPVTLLAVLSLMRSARRWEDPVVRARIVQTVASG